MMEIKDPAIKLFGKTIPIAGDGEDSPCESNASSNFSSQQDADKELAEEETMGTDQPDDPPQAANEESANLPTVAETDENQKATDSEKDFESQKKDENESNDTKNSQQKTLKKPDKILPCPRCNSMDTKFCYYNNYNINQPRHFCKSCQRYWTAGGTMRNVPVGAGRRKNKSSVSRYCHLTVAEALQAARLDLSDGVHHTGLNTNGTVLTFGSDNPLCESMVSVLNIGDNKVLNGTTKNGFHGIEHVVPIPCRSNENGDDRSSGSTVTTTSSIEDAVKKGGPQEPIKQNLNGFPSQMPCFQWPYMWNPAVPVPPFCPSGFPMPFYPAPYWNGAIPWNVPWVPPCPPGQTSPSSNPNSQTLGKHSRDGVLKPSENAKGSGAAPTVLVPKTLRIDDPDEAAKSSIWTTLGIKKDKVDSTSKGGFFNSLHSKVEVKHHKKDASPALKANPAALCRSISFLEGA